MTHEITKREDGTGPIQALRALRTLSGDELASITKTALKDGPHGLAARGLSLIQHWNEARFWQAFLNVVEDMRSEGAIREDFHTTDAGTGSLREFFEMIDGKPDEERFEAFCALFMSANAPDADASSAIVDLELMRSLRALSAGEMHLLVAFLKIQSSVSGATLWSRLSNELGYGSRTLISRNGKSLFEQGLIINETAWGNLNPVSIRELELLTDLGKLLLQRINRYNSFKNRAGG